MADPETDHTTPTLTMSSLQKALNGGNNAGVDDTPKQDNDDVQTQPSPSSSSIGDSKRNDSPITVVTKTGKHVLETVTRALAFQTAMSSKNEDDDDASKATTSTTTTTANKIHPTVHSVWRNILSAPKKLGHVWDSSTAYRAFHQGKLVSKMDQQQQHSSIRLVFRNLTNEPVVIGWVNHTNTLELYKEIPPQPFPSKQHANDITKQDYVLSTNPGHTFALVLCDDFDDDDDESQQQDFEDMIGAYRPLDVGAVGKDQKDFVVQLITIEETHEWMVRPCKPTLSNTDDVVVSEDDDVKPYSIHSRLVMLDETPVDSTNKLYTETDLGGWKCFVEDDDWYGGDESIKQRIVDDLTAAKDALPAEAREILIESTPIYINKTMEYGPEACPIKGMGLCYHPVEGDWLERMGMSTDKKGCIELYNVTSYMEDCKDLWGPGGAFLHELAHAYHAKVIQDGFDNDSILRCYTKAMKEGLYDHVHVKQQGGEGEDVISSFTTRGYASVDATKYFAELSTAFLGGKDDTKHFDKWEPFNRTELMKHDPRAYRLLQRLWKVADCTEKLAPSSSKKVLPLSVKTTMSKRKLGGHVGDGA